MLSLRCLGPNLDPFSRVRYCLYILMHHLLSVMFVRFLSLSFTWIWSVLVVTSVHQFVSVVSGLQNKYLGY